ncbi:hypothetical protein BDZ89DRAFT_1136560 [Hymenopellis radicata]|nr:hypothetical protein BDZ89DRAFT_1136560 [Hymenopellis radicata]
MTSPLSQSANAMAENASIEPLGTRLSCEMSWVAIQPFLESRGYRLRPRFHPNWEPSWIRRGMTFSEAWNHPLEDAMVIPCRADLVDAIGPDGRKVILKRVAKGSNEEIMSIRLNALDKEDPFNHLVPLLDTIDLPNEEQVLLVMPCFRPSKEVPSFHCREEVIEYTRQLLEGIVFLHSHNFSHRDICASNIVMDSSRVVPSGFHFAAPYLQEACENCNWVKTRRRCRVRPVKYFFIDFESVSFHPEGTENARVLGIFGQYNVMPELSLSVPYNPFKVDIFQAAWTILAFFENYGGLDDFKDFFQTFCTRRPEARPTAAEALAAFESFVSAMKPRERKYLVWDKQEFFHPRIIQRSLVRICPPLNRFL